MSKSMLWWCSLISTELYDPCNRCVGAKMAVRKKNDNMTFKFNFFFLDRSTVMLY